MRILKRNKLKWDKRCIIAYILVIILSIICGIVLFKLNNISNYVYEFTDVYIFYVFNFKSGTLFISHIISELFYLYFVFLLAYFTRLKFLAYPLLFLRTVFFALYVIILCAFFGSDGIIVAFIVFIPSFICSVLFYIFISEQCRLLCTPYSLILPAALALVNTVILLLLVNVVFRVIVVIV